MATELTTNDIDDGWRAGSLLDQVAGPIASFTGDGAYDRDDVYDAVTERHPEAAVIVPPRTTAVPSEAANIARKDEIAALCSGEPCWRARHQSQLTERDGLARPNNLKNARCSARSTFADVGSSPIGPRPGFQEWLVVTR